jgi:predicted lipid-binding transport protein (Tim44 family)
MKTMLKISVIAISLAFMLLADVPFLPIKLVPEAQAIFGVRRRTAVVAYSAGAASGEAKAAASQQQAAAAQQQAAAAATPAPPAAAAGQPLPVGTVVSALPKGCVSTPVGGVEYYYCGGNFYRAVFQGNQLVYVTAQPK